VTQNVKKSRRSPLASSAWGALWGAVLLVASLALGAGCSSSDCEGDECKQCSDADCPDGQRCVQRECRSACTSDAQCDGGQVCRGYQFRSGDEGDYCVVVGRGGDAPSGGGMGGKAAGPSGRFSSCDASSDCDEAHGFFCFEGECTYACSSHADCIEVGHCDSRIVDGERRQLCVRDEEPPKPGQLYTSCPRGDECEEAPLCLGAGAGDLDAYCTVGCGGDDDCAAGYFCGSVTRAPCSDACGLAGQPSDPRCVSADQIGADKPYQCGDRGVERSVCRLREFCASCDTDADCLGMPNQVCARDASGAKICTRLCDARTRSCPWGNAAECGVFDEELGLATCSHRYGSCHGDGETCSPCTSDADCPNGGCTGSSFTGERWCINFRTTCDCEGEADGTGLCASGGCPKSPSGLQLNCVGSPDSDLFNICYAANSGSASVLGSSPQTGCWGPN
jgi:hypothetical protein